MPKSDKNTLRKTARDLWDSIVELYTDSTALSGGSNSSSKSGQQQQQQGQQQHQQQSNAAPYDASNLSSLLAHQQHQMSSSAQQQQQQQSILKDNQALIANRALLRKLLVLIKSIEVKNLVISLLATVFNIADSQVCKI